MANPTLLKTPIASGGDKNTIPETTGSTTGLLSQEKGWQQINSLPINAGGIAPSRLDFNGVFNLLSNILFYAQKGWQWEFDETQSYFAGCTVKDTVDGKTYVCIADVSASTTHPSRDTTHWKLSDLATKGDLANYLPLAGGTLKGELPSIVGGNSCLATTMGTNGAKVVAYSTIAGGGNAGILMLLASDGTNSKALQLYPNGTIQWGSANVLTDANGGYLPLGGGALTGNEINRNVDNASIDIIGATDLLKGAWLNLSGKDSSGGGSFTLFTANGTIRKALTGNHDGSLTWNNNDLGGSAIVAKSLGTTGYTKRADGLIEQWGQTTAPATVSENVPVTFPITFPNAVSSVVITSEGNLTEGNSPMSYTQVIDVTNSGFKYRSFFISPGEIKKYWRAIGY